MNLIVSKSRGSLVKKMESHLSNLVEYPNERVCVETYETLHTPDGAIKRYLYINNIQCKQGFEDKVRKVALQDTPNCICSVHLYNQDKSYNIISMLYSNIKCNEVTTFETLKTLYERQSKLCGWLSKHHQNVNVSLNTD